MNIGCSIFDITVYRVTLIVYLFLTVKHSLRSLYSTVCAYYSAVCADYCTVCADYCTVCTDYTFKMNYKKVVLESYGRKFCLDNILHLNIWICNIEIIIFFLLITSQIILYDY